MKKIKTVCLVLVLMIPAAGLAKSSKQASSDTSSTIKTYGIWDH